VRWGTSIRRRPVPASVSGLDPVRVARVLVKRQANVSAAARDLGVPSADLRKLTWSHPWLVEVALEEAERLVDRAEARLTAALDGPHPDRALAAATFILSHHRAARERGWGPHSGPYRNLYEVPPAAAPTVVIWAGDAAGYRPLAPNVPEARAALAASTDPASKGDRIH
jgi:hypothetical protein